MNALLNVHKVSLALIYVLILQNHQNKHIMIGDVYAEVMFGSCVHIHTKGRCCKFAVCYEHHEGVAKST